MREAAEGAEHSPGDPVESKRSAAAATTRSRGGRGGGLAFAALQFGSMDLFSILEGSPSLFPLLAGIYAYNLEIKGGANWGDLGPALRPLPPPMDRTERQLWFSDLINSQERLTQEIASSPS